MGEMQQHQAFPWAGMANRLTEPGRPGVGAAELIERLSHDEHAGRRRTVAPGAGDNWGRSPNLSGPLMAPISEGYEALTDGAAPRWP